MKKAILVISLLILTIGFGFYEVFAVKNVLSTMQNSITYLDDKFEENQQDISIYYEEIKEVRNSWEEKERWLCFLFNHRDLSIITDSFNRLLAYTENNDYDNATSELSMLKEYSTKSHHIMGFNIHNIL